MWQECGKPRHETGNQPPIDRPKDLSRAPNAAPGNLPLGKDPRGCFSHSLRRGQVEGTTPSTRNRPRKFFNFSWDPYPNFFWRIKIVLLAPRLPRRMGMTATIA